MSRCRSGLIDAKRSLSKAGHENPNYETTRQVKKQAFYIGFTSFDAEKCAELKNSIINRLNGQSHYGIAHFQK